jgi:NAD(P)-dependent dehydrogenase (short-subunit alcohol dehydrogenase family)
MAAERGWAVAVNSNQSAARAEEVVERVRSKGGRAEAIKADVATEEGAIHLFAETDRKLGRATGLFNNAGIVHPNQTITAFDARTLEEQWRVNITSQFLCAREAVKRMSTRLGGTGGAIVNMSSRASVLGGGGALLAYAASKGAIDTFTQGLAIETAPQGIRVNAVRPGLIETEIHDDTGDLERLKRLVALVPMGRTAPPEEVAEVVVWLLSPAASYVTASIVDIAGGR